MELIDEYMASPDTESGRASGTVMAELVDVVAATDRMLASVSAMRADAIDQMRVWSETSTESDQRSMDPRSMDARKIDARSMARRSLVAELACALRVPEGSAERLLAESETLVHDLAATRTALQQGEISYRHAKALIDHAWSLPEEARAGFEKAVLPGAKTLTVAKFDGTARKAREKSHPDSITIRQRKCVGDRSLHLLAARDGMAWLNAYLPATNAHAVFDRVSGAAQSLQGTDEARTLTQLRVDVFTDLLVDGVVSTEQHPSGLGRGIRAGVNVTVPVMTLLGHSEDPGHLEGYGPIDPDTARRLAANAPSFTRILIHPETGCVLSVGRTRYKVPKDLRRWLRVRDETCRFPGCNRSAARCDLDHAEEWQDGGRTQHDNLAHLCGPHHKLKSEAGWTVVHARDGTLTWASPSGKRYLTESATRIEPAPPF